MMEKINMNEKINVNTVLNVLSLEDSQPDFEIIRNQFINAGYNLKLTHIENEKDFTSSIRSNKYDIILADFNLQGFNAFGALRLCNEICPTTPFICVSGSIGEETAIELIKEGAVDYILKDRLVRLPSAVKRALDEAKEKECRKRSEEELIRSEAKQRLVLENINEIVYSIKQISPDSTEGIPDFVSNRSESILGIKPNEFIQHPELWFSLIHPDDIGMIEKQTSDIFTAKEIGLRLYRLLNKQSGKYIWVEDLVVPQLDDKNRVIGTFGVARNITDRKLAEDALKDKVGELQRFHDLTVGRELKMIELKKEINELLKELGREAKYVIVG